MTIELRSLTISRNEYGENKGNYTGKVYFKRNIALSGEADINIPIPEAISAQIVALCADILVGTMRDSMNVMIEDLAPALPAPADFAEEVATQIDATDIDIDTIDAIDNEDTNDNEEELDHDDTDIPF